MSPAFTRRQADLIAELVHLERERLGLSTWGIPGVMAALRGRADTDVIRTVAAFLTMARNEAAGSPAVAALPGSHWEVLRPDAVGQPTPTPPPFQRGRRTDAVTPERAAEHVALLRQIIATRKESV